MNVYLLNLRLMVGFHMDCKNHAASLLCNDSLTFDVFSQIIVLIIRLHSLVSINGAEGNFRSYKEALEDETIIPEYNTLVTASDMPNWLRWIARKVIDKRRGHLLSCTRKFCHSLILIHLY
jgi:hypothetical protein